MGAVGDDVAGRILRREQAGGRVALAIDQLEHADHFPMMILHGITSMLLVRYPYRSSNEG